MANGCASVSPVIKLYLSFHQGDRRRGQMKRRETEGTPGRRNKRGADEGCSQEGEIMDLMHPSCNFLSLSNLSFLSSVHTTRHWVALKSYWGEINWSKDGGTSLISLNILFAPYFHAVFLIFSPKYPSFQTFFHSLHFSTFLPSSIFLFSLLAHASSPFPAYFHMSLYTFCVPRLPLIKSWLANLYSFPICFISSLYLPYSPVYVCSSSCLFCSHPSISSNFFPPSLLSSGTCISLQVLQGTQRGAVKAAASPRTAPSILAKRGAAEGQQH